jgi:hypothetical protein
MNVAGPDIVEFATSRKYLGKDYYSTHQVAILKGLYGLAMSREEELAFREMSDGRKPRKGGYTKAALVCGTRGGKSDLASVIGTYECVRWGPILEDLLMPGQLASGIIVAENKKQGGIVRGYIEGNFRTLEGKGYQVFAATRGQERAVTESVIKLHWPIEIVIYPATKAGMRGTTGLFFIGDEIAWWRSEEGAYNQDREVIRAARSRFATLARLGPKQIMISSPNQESGVLYDEWKNRHRSRTMVVTAPTAMLNPAIPQSFLDGELLEDSEAFERDYGAKFQAVGGGLVFLSPQIVESNIDVGRDSLPVQPSTEYRVAIDAAFKRDRFAMGIAHLEERSVVVDRIRYWTPPREKGQDLDPDVVVDEIVSEIRPYGVDKLYGDQFADVPLKRRFADSGITFVERPQSAPSSFEMWKNLRAVLRASLASLPDDREMIKELKGLVASKTRTKVTHVGAPNVRGRFDDIAKVIALLVQELLPLAMTIDIHALNRGAMDSARSRRGLDWDPRRYDDGGSMWAEDEFESAFESIESAVM